MKKLSLIFALVLALGLIWAQGTESFNNLTISSSSYSSGSFGGDTVDWTFVTVREAADNPIDGKGITFKSASESYLEATIPGGIGNFSFKARKAFSGGTTRTVEVLINGVTKYTTPPFDAVQTFNFDVNVPGSVTLRIKPAGTSAQTTVDTFVWTGHVSTEPTLNVSETSLTGFTYEVNQGPSTAQTFTVGGANLGTNNVTITAVTNFEVSLTQDSGYSGSLTLIPDNGSVTTTTVYVRLKTGLDVGTYETNEIEQVFERVTVQCAAQGLTDKIVELSGSVTAPPPPRYFVDFEGEGEFTAGTAYLTGEKMLSGKNWYLNTVAIPEAPLSGDWYDGTRSARLRGYGGTCMTMLEDKTNGAGTVSFQYRQYGGDTQTTWKVKYSTDQGNTWQEIPFDPPNNNTFKATATVQLFSYDLNTSRNIRLRIEEATGSGSSNRRMNIDNIEITDFYDFPNGEGTQANSENTITVTGGHANYSVVNTQPGDPPDPSFVVSFHRCLTLLGSGPWTISVSNDTAQWAAYKQGGTWYSAAFDQGVATLTVTAAKNQEIELLTGSGNDPTLPVTLSHFSATMTAENYVQLTWISQTETNLMGYNVYRSNSDNLSSATQICPMIEGTNTSQAQTYVYVDKDLVEDGTYYYWLQNVDLDGSNAFHGPVSAVFSITGNGGTPPIPTATQLDNAYPNPFNPNTTIRYQLEGAGKVKIEIYNTRGQLVRSFEKGHDAAGHYGIVWDGRDSSGRELPSGVYLYKMSCGKYSSSKKMVLKK